MRLVSLSAAALALAIPMPVLAQSAPHSASEPVPQTADEAVKKGGNSKLMGKLSDPAEQKKMAAMLAVMGEVLLELPVGPLLEMAATASGEDVIEVDSNATVRDLAGPDAERIPKEINDKLPKMMGAMAGMAKSMEAMAPMLEGMAKQMREAVKDSE